MTTVWLQLIVCDQQSSLQKLVSTKILEPIRRVITYFLFSVTHRFVTKWLEIAIISYGFINAQRFCIINF